MALQTWQNQSFNTTANHTRGSRPCSSLELSSSPVLNCSCPTQSKVNAVHRWLVPELPPNWTNLSPLEYHLVSLSFSRLHNSTFLTSKLIHLSLNSPPSNCTKSFPRVLMLQLQEEAPGRDTCRGWSRLGLTFSLSWELGSGLSLAFGSWNHKGYRP